MNSNNRGNAALEWALSIILSIICVSIVVLYAQSAKDEFRPDVDKTSLDTLCIGCAEPLGAPLGMVVARMDFGQQGFVPADSFGLTDEGAEYIKGIAEVSPIRDNAHTVCITRDKMMGSLNFCNGNEAGAVFGLEVELPYGHEHWLPLG